MTTDPRRRDIYMHVSALEQTKTQSPEEIRINDYITAYSTTGQPPAPVPQEPTNERERVALGLPPLFQPVEMFPEPTTPTRSNSSKQSIFGTVSSITDPAQLPGIHAFQPVVENGEKLENISAMRTFLCFSSEELRYYAYLAGVIYAPQAPVDLPPIPDPPVSSPVIQPFVAKDSTTNAFFHEADPAKEGSTLCYMTLTASRRFDKHSIEELRIAFLQAGREIDSSQITPISALGIVPSPSTTLGSALFGAPGGAFSHSPAVRPF